MIALISPQAKWSKTPFLDRRYGTDQRQAFLNLRLISSSSFVVAALAFFGSSSFFTSISDKIVVLFFCKKRKMWRKGWEVGRETGDILRTFTKGITIIKFDPASLPKIGGKARIDSVLYV